MLALAGVGGLATAIVLVPSMVRQFAAARNADPSPVVHKTGKSPDSFPKSVATVDAVQTEEVEGKIEEKVEEKIEEKVEEENSAAASVTKWTIELDPGNYEIMKGGGAAVDAIVHFLTTNEDAKVKLTGVNHPNKSTKRSKKAARIIKDEIIRDVGVAKHRVSIAVTQEPEVTGLLVRAEIMRGRR